MLYLILLRLQWFTEGLSSSHDPALRRVRLISPFPGGRAGRPKVGQLCWVHVFYELLCEPFGRAGRVRVKERTMSKFTPEEIAYLQSQHIGRLATISEAGELHVVPVTFRYHPEH